jgi:hypothetical protein
MSKKIIRILLEKLEQETRRSPFLNCLQGFSSGARFDLTRLNTLSPFTARDILRELFKSEGKSIEIKLTDEMPPEAILDQLQYSVAADELDDLFRKLYAKGNDLFRETGQHNIYIGFPLLSHFDAFDETKSFMAPLMFWPVTIAPGKNFDRWYIEKNTDSEVRLNYALKNWLLDNNMRLPEEPDAEAMESCSITYEQLENYLVSIAEIFHVPGEWRNQYFVTDTLGPNPLRFGSLKSFNEELHRLGFDLHLSAVMGVFQANKEGIIQDLKTYLDQETSLEIEQAGEALFQEFPFSLVDLDPAQWTTHETIGAGGHAVVHGPPGTGKSTVLTGIISTALANNRRVLMVSEKRTALDVIAQKLGDLEIEDAYVTIADVVEGRRAVVSKARNIQDESLHWKPAKPLDYAAQRTAWSNYRRKYATYCAELNEVMFNGMRFEELMLHYLQIAQEVNTLSISSELLQHVEQHPEDFKRLSEYLIVNHAQVLADYLAFFRQRQWPVAVMANANEFKRYRSEQIAELNREIILLRKQELLVRELIPLQQEHDAYMIEGSFVRLVKRLVRMQRRKHYQTFNQLLRWNPDAAQIPQFSFALESIQQRIAFSTEELAGIEALNLSEEDGKRCAADFERLSKVPGLPAFDDVEQLLRTSNAALVWEKSVFKMLLDRKKARMQSSFAWEEMKEVMVWLSEQRETGKTLVQQHYRRNVQREVKRADKSYGMRRLYNLRGSRGEERNSLRQIVQSDPELFLSLFPVTMCTPEVAAILFRGARSLFDLVIFDEASQIRVEDAFTGLLKGKTVVIAGDRHQMPPSNWFESDGDDRISVEPSDNVIESLSAQALHAESILDFAIHHPLFGDTYLTYHYRSEHADLIAFSNAAFYGNLKPMTINRSLQPFGFHTVGGVYGQQTNEQEASAVVQWICSMQPDEHGDFPSLGIVTLNLKQRDLILKLLARERRNHSEINARVAKLEEAGLFVRNLENIQGDERDIIVLSTTFGVNAEGSFNRQFGKLGTRAGYRLLNVLITRARLSIQVFTSFPEHALHDYAHLLMEKRGNWGSGLIFAYIEFVRQHAAGQGCSESVLSLLASLREDLGSEEAQRFDVTRGRLVAMLLSNSLPDDDFAIGTTLAGITVDAHNHVSSYHLHLGAGIADEDDLVQAIHRLHYLEKAGIDVLELEV